MKLKFAEPDSSRYDADTPEREDLSKDEVIKLAMQSYGWKESKCISWYKLQIPQLGGNSPMELVQRQQTAKMVSFLRKKAAELSQNKSAQNKTSE